MGIAEDIVARQQLLAANRVGFEAVWQRVADYVFPSSPDVITGLTYTTTNALGLQGPNSRTRVPLIYEGTGIWAAERLVAGLLGLVTPQNEKWHNLTLDDVFAPQVTHEEALWLDLLRDYLFADRYNPKSAFQYANAMAVRSMVMFGTGIFFTNSRPNRPATHYRYIPHSENYIDIDENGDVDTNFRRFSLSAKNAVRMFGGKVSEKVRQCAENEKRKDELVEFIHAVMPRQERGAEKNEARNAPWAAFYVEVATNTVIDESGFFEFPYIDYRWNPHEKLGWGEGPVMLAMAEILTLNSMGKAEIKSAQQMIAPPLATTGHGVMNRPDLNPRAVNPGALDRQGNLKIKPIVTGARPDFASMVMEPRRETVKEFLYVNLFQTLLQSPGMTATEALIRADEKGQLLGPAGTNIQAGQARMVDREIATLERGGAFEPRSRLAPPESLGGRDVKPGFKAPINRLQRSPEAIGIQRTWEQAGMIAGADPDVIDNLDSDESIRILSEINGAPYRIMRPAEAVAQIRNNRVQMQQAQQAAAIAKDAAAAGKDGVPAIAQLAELAQSTQSS